MAGFVVVFGAGDGEELEAADDPVVPLETFKGRAIERKSQQRVVAAGVGEPGRPRVQRRGVGVVGQAEW